MPHRGSPEVFKKSVKSVPKGTTELNTPLHKFTIQDVEVALHLLVLNGGNYRRTVAELEETEKLSVSAVTLQKWAVTLFARRYLEIQDALQDQIGKELSARLTENSQRAVDTQREIIETLDANVHELAIKDLPSAARSLGAAASMNIEKAALLRDKPTEIVQERGPEEILADLDKLNVIPSTAEDITDED